MTPRMTSEEYMTKQAELLERLPIELRTQVGYLAYDQGHSSGYEEVIGVLGELVTALEEPCKKLIARVKSEK